MRMRSFILFVLLLLSGLLAFSQGSVGVNKPTGTIQVSIPLYTVSVGNVSLPIGLFYVSTGIRPTDIENNAGIGWQLSAGGAITRQLRGLPDDIYTDNGSSTRTGWLNSTNGNTINSMGIANTTNPPAFDNVAPDLSFIQSHFTNSDTEPDIFNVSAPGLNLQFVFDKDHVIRTIPYQDVKISYTTGTNGITSFTVTNDKGVTYVFSATETTIRQAKGASTPSWFATDHAQYLNGITFTSAWKLTQIHDLYNNAININYTAGNYMPNSMNVQVYLNGSATATTLYPMWEKTTPQLLSSITYQEGNGTGSPVTAFTFTNMYNNYTHANFVSTMTGFGRAFQFNYTANVHSGDNYTRYFLTNVTDADCNTPVNYSFSYNNLSNLPDSTNTREDYWGYTNNNSFATSLAPLIEVNPSNTTYDRFRNLVSDDINRTIYPYAVGGGSTRAVSASDITTAALNQINYATGGYTTISYEPNDYYDNIGSQVNQGGGIRVTQISHYDGINASPNTTTYTYLDPSTGLSSGKPLSFPCYAFTQAYSSSEADSTRWRKSTVISWSDLSSDDHTVMYGYVKESRTGAGNTLYQFSVPVNEWDGTTPTGAPAWSPTMVYSGSPTNIPIGYLNNIIRTYPFPPSTNYDFERGLPLDVTNYDNNGNKVSEATYTYNTPQTPVTITAFKYDANTLSEESYGKYYIYTTAGPLITQVVNKLYSQSAPTAYRQTTENYTYGGTLHKLLTHASATNSDGTQTDKYIKYVKDYVITAYADSMTHALLKLQAANVNAPIETYAQVTPSGGTASTVSADLVKYSTYSPSGYVLTLPSQHLKIANPNGTTFTPSSISTSSPNTFINDSQYIPVENNLAYDYSGYLLSSDNGFKHRSTVLIDHNSFQPAAAINNTRYDKIAFSDFDSKLPYVNFTSSGTLTATHRSGQFADSVASGGTFTKTIVRDSLASNYVISAWIRCTSTAGTMSATITGGGQTGSGSTAYNVTTNPATYPTGWQYVEFKVPITSITTSSMLITLSCNTAVIIDDIWAYPDLAEVSSVAYDPVAFFKTAVTNTNGVAAYYSYDKFGRLLYAYDQDKNIVQRKIYASAANETNFNAPAISGPTTAYNHASGSWSMATPSYNTCVQASGVTYTWNFGDGTAPIVTASYYPQSHTYQSNGTYTISLTVSSPTYGSKASTYSVTVSTLTQSNITYTNATSGSSIASVVFKQHSTGTVMYTLSTSQLAAGYTITPDIYDITITPTGPHYNSGTGQGYGCVAFNAGNDISLCFPYTGSAFTATSVDLRYEPNIFFGMYTSPSCP